MEYKRFIALANVNFIGYGILFAIISCALDLDTFWVYCLKEKLLSFIAMKSYFVYDMLR